MHNKGLPIILEMKEKKNEAEHIFAEMHGFSLHLECTACIVVVMWQSMHIAVIGYEMDLRPRLWYVAQVGSL
jgi:hypothetical protein